jgi:AcrR family transcriptional regulator
MNEATCTPNGVVRSNENGREGASNAATSPDDVRRAAIEAAAYDVLRERGYRRASMLTIAKRAGASNQTLYRWYGSKQGLFAALIRRNTEVAVRALAVTEGHDLDARMQAFGVALLTLLTGARAVALNRAAAADASETGELGQALARSGRDHVVPLLRAVLMAAQEDGELNLVDLDEAAERYVTLLVGDLQIRRVTGALEPLDAESIERRARQAWRTLRSGRMDCA